MRRRDALRTLLTFAGASLPGFAALASGCAAAATVTRTGSEAFDFARLKGRARAIAATPYTPRTRPLPGALRRLDWDRYQAIRFRDSRSLWIDDHARFLVKFFHPGWHYDQPVRVHEVLDGRAREIALDAGMFDYAKSGLSGVDPTPGFAGLRVCFHTDPKRDVTAFLGASYFRAVGGDGQYGLSARGLAVDCGLGRPEEFPLFTEFWLERPAGDSDVLTLYALLEFRRASPARIASTSIPAQRW
jgi:glucans biosynthesis protein